MAWIGWVRLEMHLLGRMFRLELHRGVHFAEYFHLFGGWVQIPIVWRFIGCDTCSRSFYVRGGDEKVVRAAMEEFREFRKKVGW